MNKNHLVIAVVLLLLCLSPTIYAQSIGTNTAEAVIAEALTATAGTTLNFGALIPSGTAGTVRIATDGSRTPSAEVTALTSTFTAATFDITGTPNLQYSIALPAAGTVQITDGGGNAMDVDNWESDPATFGTLDSGGAETVNVGATLYVGASQPAGSYSGSFSVTFNYQ
jgi:hypothetical protein